MGISQTLRRWTEGATYVRKGDHHIGHWPTFLVIVFCPVFEQPCLLKSMQKLTVMIIIVITVVLMLYFTCCVLDKILLRDTWDKKFHMVLTCTRLCTGKPQLWSGWRRAWEASPAVAVMITHADAEAVLWHAGGGGSGGWENSGRWWLAFTVNSTHPSWVSSVTCCSVQQHHNNRFTAVCPGLPGWASTTTHPPSWSSSSLYQLLPSAAIHSILPVQITCLVVFLHNLCPRPVLCTSWSEALHLLVHTFLHAISVFFLQHMPILSQPVLL